MQRRHVGGGRGRPATSYICPPAAARGRVRFVRHVARFAGSRARGLRGSQARLVAAGPALASRAVRLSISPFIPGPLDMSVQQAWIYIRPQKIGGPAVIRDTRCAFLSRTVVRSALVPRTRRSGPLGAAFGLRVGSGEDRATRGASGLRAGRRGGAGKSFLPVGGGRSGNGSGIVTLTTPLSAATSSSATTSSSLPRPLSGIPRGLTSLCQQPGALSWRRKGR